ncbi:unnamed protein product [Pleuronectes platessa]|uniref:Uncharacterized protein n=1 Tax=Pleuronectes platessa TaxID=8262 RepID=A0A9N7UBU4_PLEPL|nr:unnamed protein product [Pleuronectes platessa]
MVPQTLPTSGCVLEITRFSQRRKRKAKEREQPGLQYRKPPLHYADSTDREIAADRVAQSRFITRVLTLQEKRHVAGLSHQPLDHQRCFPSPLEQSITGKHDGGEVAHCDCLLGSMLTCHVSPGGRQGADGAYVRETDGVDGDPLPSMLSCGGPPLHGPDEETRFPTCGAPHYSSPAGGHCVTCSLADRNLKQLDSCKDKH